MKTKRWVITGIYGRETLLYTDQQLTRSAAIAEHVSALWSGRDGLPEISPFVLGRVLDRYQRKAWRRCKKNGDRAVLATVCYPAR